MKMPYFYSFDFNRVHIVSIGTEDNPINAYETAGSAYQTADELPPELKKRFDLHYGEKSEQYRWLKADLEKANANRERLPWIVLFTHRPMYHTSTHHPNCR